ncbi:fumarylacetoacetase [Flavobacterium daejeonense]|uniref:fumarylacetoacetase n=1 Tax=Flavobacterium daejeonense TaxID=350893 RepID=UPI000479F194|nr:fumarylacetoacetase [Flavobacterium daejeonense]
MNQSKSWIEIPENSDFTLANIPFGVYSNGEGHFAVATAIGEYVVDLDMLHKAGYFGLMELPSNIFKNRFLNPFIALGKEKTNAVRKHIQELFTKGSTLENDGKYLVNVLHKQQDVKMLLPVKIGNYTDFYSSKEHAANVGIMFRDPENALLPNWLHMPVGYHGRASSIVVSETPIHRPNGQIKDPAKDKPDFGSSKRLDFELEMAFVIGKETQLGDMVSVNNAEDYIFGMMLFNDWSARDIQVWEYVPLGPFLGKNFASSVSPWIVTMEALEPFRTNAPEQTVEVLPYLKEKQRTTFDIQLEVAIATKDAKETVVCQSNFKYLYWTMPQQLAHHTINGCNIEIGDMYASGTISGTTPESFGSMLELAWKGTKPLQLADGSTRVFIQDGDKVIMRGHAGQGAQRVGFGSVRTEVLPAKNIVL